MVEPIPTASSGPSGITTVQDGLLWFTEDQGNQIGRITPDGQRSEEFPASTPSQQAPGHHPRISEYPLVHRIS